MKLFKSRILPLPVICLIFILPLNDLSAQAFHVKKYTVESGLPTSAVNSVTQDSLGQIWFATRIGVTRYDGYVWRTYSISDGLSSNDIHSLKTDSSGNIWAMTGGAHIWISHFTNDKWNNIPFYIKLKDSDFSATSFDIDISKKDTIIVVSTIKKGLFYFIKNEWHHLTGLNNIPTENIFYVKQYDGKFYVGTDKGLLVYKFKSDGKPILVEHILQNRNIYSINYELDKKEKNNSKLWLLGRNFVGYLDDEKLNVVNNSFNLRIQWGEPAGAILPGYFGKVLFGNQFSLFMIDEKTTDIKILDEISGLLESGVTDILLDREKNLWIAGKRGVNKIQSMRFENYGRKQGLLRDEVTSVLEPEPGVIYLGHKDGISILNGNRVKRMELIPEDSVLASNIRILDMNEDLQGNIWLSVDRKGFAVLDRNLNIRWIDLGDKINRNAYSTVTDSKGNIYLSAQHSLYKRVNGKFKKLMIGGYFCRKLFIDDEDKIYAATGNNGILIIQNDEIIKTIKSKSFAKANNVYSIFIDNSDNGKIYAGTLDGLYVVDGDSLKKFNESDFSIDRPVYFIVKDKNNNFWFGTDFGVNKWDGKNHFHFDTGLGLSGLETNRDAGFLDSKGRVWIGTESGVSRYTPELDFNPGAKSKIVLKSVDASGKIYDLSKSISIDYSNNNLVFDVRIVSFINEDENSYIVKLEGFDDYWLPETRSDDHMIRYTNLPAGNYKLKISSKNALDIWSEIKTSNPIIIKRPFYQEWWFYAFAIIVSGYLLFGLFLYYRRVLYTKELKSEVAKRTKLLDESEKRYRQMFEANQAIMLLLDPETSDIIDANSAALDYYGYEFNKIINMKMNQIDRAFDFELVKENILNNLDSKNHYLSRHKLSSGNVRDVEIYFSQFQVKSRDLLFAIIHDITERKRAEKELIIAKEEAEKSDRLKSDFLAQMSHEIRTPVNTILNFTSLLEDELVNKVSDDLKGSFKIINDGGLRLIRTIDMILNMSQIQTGTYKPYFRMVDLDKDILQSIIGELKRPAANKEIMLNYKVDSGNLKIKGDNYTLGQIFVNLIDNAIKYTHEGGVDVLLTENDKKIIVEIADTGVGISDEFLPQLFSPFAQEETGYTRRFEGTGLGLALVKNYVKMNDADIKVKSKKGEGTRFIIMFDKLF